MDAKPMRSKANILLLKNVVGWCLVLLGTEFDCFTLSNGMWPISKGSYPQIKDSSFCYLISYLTYLSSFIKIV